MWTWERKFNSNLSRARAAFGCSGHNIQFVSLTHFVGFSKKKKSCVTCQSFTGYRHLFYRRHVLLFSISYIYPGKQDKFYNNKTIPFEKEKKIKKERLQLQYWSVGNRVPAGVVVGGTPLTRFDCLLWCLPLVAQLHSCVFGLLLSTTLSNLSIYTASRWI